MRPSSILFTIALAASPPATAEDTHRLQLDVGATGLWGTTLHAPLKLGAPPPNFVTPASWQRAAGEVEAALTLFFRPLRDDDAPPSLQPFLQRAGSIRVRGAGFFREQGNNAQADVREEQLAVGVDASGYLTPWLWLSAGAGTAHVAMGQGTPFMALRTDWMLPFSAGIGVRIRDVLIHVDYANHLQWWALTGKPYELIRQWMGEVRVGARAVLRRQLDLSAFARLFDAQGHPGGGAGLFAQWFVRPRTGPFANIEYQYMPPLSPREAHEVRFTGGVTHWWTTHVGATAALALTWGCYPNFGGSGTCHTYDWLDGSLSAELHARW